MSNVEFNLEFSNMNVKYRQNDSDKKHTAKSVKCQLKLSECQVKKENINRER